MRIGQIVFGRLPDGRTSEWHLPTNHPLLLDAIDSQTPPASLRACCRGIIGGLVGLVIFAWRWSRVVFGGGALKDAWLWYTKARHEGWKLADVLWLSRSNRMYKKWEAFRCE